MSLDKSNVALLSRGPKVGTQNVFNDGVCDDVCTVHQTDGLYRYLIFHDWNFTVQEYHSQTAVESATRNT